MPAPTAAAPTDAPPPSFSAIRRLALLALAAAIYAVAGLIVDGIRRYFGTIDAGTVLVDVGTLLGGHGRASAAQNDAGEARKEKS